MGNEWIRYLAVSPQRSHTSHFAPSRERIGVCIKKELRCIDPNRQIVVNVPVNEIYESMNIKFSGVVVFDISCVLTYSASPIKM